VPYGQKTWVSWNITTWKDSLIPLKLYSDSLDAPSGWAAQADSAIAELSGPKTYNNVKWSIQQASNNSSVEIKYGSMSFIVVNNLKKKLEGREYYWK
jgi:hypothetical protein